MSTQFTLCLRCKNKEAVFNCLSCDSFKFLCTQCDNYVHSLPSKKNHRRNAILEQVNIINQEEVCNIRRDEYDGNNYDRNTIDWDYKFNLSPVNNEYNNKDKENINIQDQSTNINTNTKQLNTISNSSYNNLHNINNNNINSGSRSNYNLYTSSNSLIDGTLMTISSSYSREYVNEMKVNFFYLNNSLFLKKKKVN
jgi:hypothetical protein